MCIIALAHRASARYPLILGANRDESHARPTARAGWWTDAPRVLGGRDLASGGTWLAVTRGGRIAAVTNRRPETESAVDPRRSRGLLVSGFLGSRASAAEFATLAAERGDEHRPFNMLLLDEQSLCYTSNRSAPRRLPPGIQAMSNAEPEAEWPKVIRAREGLAGLLSADDPEEGLFALLAERAPPTAGFDDRQVSLFQLDPAWGTRSSTVILVDARRRVRFVERSFSADGRLLDQVRFEFEASD